MDDIWQKKNGELIIIDVKATSRNNFDWSETFNKYEYAKAYKRQLEMYQWLFKKNIKVYCLFIKFLTLFANFE